MTPDKLSKAKFSVAGVSCLFGLALVLLPARFVAGQAVARVPSIDQALEAQTASGAALSPDGQRVVYEVSRTNWRDNAFERDLWIADRAGNAHFLTAQMKSSSGAKWS